MSKANSNHFDGSLASEEEDLIQEALVEGKKINPKKVIFITRDPRGRIVWLEEGETEEEAKARKRAPSGLKHILEKHAQQFEALGIRRDQIPEFLRQLILKGDVTLHLPRADLYGFTRAESPSRILIAVASNGYIVTAYPTDKWMRLRS